MPAYYAVAKGRNPGIFSTWNQCKEQVDGFAGARYKKFPSESEARMFIEQNSGGPSSYGRAGPVATVSTSTSWNNNLNRKRKAVEIDVLPEFGVQKKSRGLEDFTVVYTDGACSNNGRNGAKAGWGVYWGDGHEDNACGAVWGEPTNNRGELIAVIKAIETAKKRDVEKLCIRTDSQLLINSMDKWIAGWKRKGWKKSDGSAVKNVDLLKQLDQLRNERTIIFEHVRGHSGEHGNEAADRLAVEGATKF